MIRNLTYSMGLRTTKTGVQEWHVKSKSQNNWMGWL
jgi:hypothetical protein